MNMREARRQAWRAAYDILVYGGMPVSEESPEGFSESESSAANFKRWERAWSEVLSRVAAHGGIEHDDKNFGSGG